MGCKGQWWIYEQEGQSSRYVVMVKVEQKEQLHNVSGTHQLHLWASGYLPNSSKVLIVNTVNHTLNMIV